MKITVKLFGTLSRRFPDYRPAEGLEIKLSEGATVKDLLALLGISEPRGVVVIVEGRILKADDQIRPGVPVNVLQAMHGG